MHSVLVTGGAGFIGSHFVDFLLKRYPEVTVVTLDKLTYAGNLANLEDAQKSPKHFFYQGDIGDEKLVSEIIKKHKITHIVNFAAETHVDNSIKQPIPFFETNVLALHKLLEAARAEKIERFVQISTDEVYGSLETGDATEESHIVPNSPYSASKASGDLLVRSYVKTYNFPAIITRSSNNFGPRQHPEKVIPLFVKRLHSGKKVPLYGTGKNTRDWLYVEDNCAAIAAVLTNGKIGEIYNIGGGKMITNFELTKHILEQFGLDESFIEFVTDRPGHDLRYSVNCSKVQSIGWKPKHEFGKALAYTVQWYRSNPQWWKAFEQEVSPSKLGVTSS